MTRGSIWRRTSGLFSPKEKLIHHTNTLPIVKINMTTSYISHLPYALSCQPLFDLKRKMRGIQIFYYSNSTSQCLTDLSICVLTLKVNPLPTASESQNHCNRLWIPSFRSTIVLVRNRKNYHCQEVNSKSITYIHQNNFVLFFIFYFMIWLSLKFLK